MLGFSAFERSLEFLFTNSSVIGARLAILSLVPQALSFSFGAKREVTKPETGAECLLLERVIRSLSSVLAVGEAADCSEDFFYCALPICVLSPSTSTW